MSVIQRFHHDLQSFIYHNRLLSTSSGFVFGMISKDYIDKLLNQIVFPLVFGVFSFSKISQNIEKNYPTFFLFLKFIGFSLIWIMSIFVSFFMLEYILNRKILGLSATVIDEADKDKYLKMKVKAKTSGIIPDEEEIKKIDNENKIIDEKINSQNISFHDLSSISYSEI